MLLSNNGFCLLECVSTLIVFVVITGFVIERKCDVISYLGES